MSKLILPTGRFSKDLSPEAEALGQLEGEILTLVNAYFDKWKLDGIDTRLAGNFLNMYCINSAVLSRILDME